MRFRYTSILLALVVVVLVSGLREARADVSQFYCSHPWAEIDLGEFSHEFPTLINSSSGDSVDVLINAVLPPGWFSQVCQVSSGICYFGDARIYVNRGIEPDTLRVDFFPNTAEAGVGYIQLEIRSVDDPSDSRYCNYVVYNGVPGIYADFDIDCTDNTVFAESGEFIHEFFAPITNTTALDDSIHVTPTTFLPDGWFGQFCQVSTGVCYFSEATIPLAAGFTDTVRVDFFPSSDGAGRINLDLYSVNNPAIFRKCFYNVFQGADGFPASVPDGISTPATVASFAQPNPFDFDTTIRFRLSESANGDLGIFTAGGREVRWIRDLRLGAGEAEVRWDGRDANGLSVPSGVYFYRFESGQVDAKGLMVKRR